MVKRKKEQGKGGNHVPKNKENKKRRGGDKKEKMWAAQGGEYR